jgi:DNA-binding phage protein
MWQIVHNFGTLMRTRQSIAVTLSIWLTTMRLDDFISEVVESLKAQGGVTPLSRRLGLRRNTFYEPLVAPGLREILGALEELGLRFWLSPMGRDDSQVRVDALNRLLLFASVKEFCDELFEQSRTHFNVAAIAKKAQIGRKLIYAPSKNVRFKPVVRLITAMEIQPTVILV